MIVKGQFALGTSLVVLCLAPIGASAADTVAADTYISAGAPATNFGTSTAINIGGGNSALIQFDLSSLPSLTAAQVSKATMSFYVNTAAITGGVDVSQVTSAWTETAVTYSSQPTFQSPFATNVPTSGGRQWVTVDVTQLVKDWVSGTAANFGVKISAAASASNTSLVLDSKENTTTSHPIFLNVITQSVGPAGATGLTGRRGPAGPTEAAGGTGPTGSAGPAGASGQTGPAGARGPTSAGATGPTGTAGAPGVNGATGAQGPSGSQGPTGASGPNGTGMRLTVNAINPGTSSPWWSGLNGEIKVSTQNPEWIGGASPIACTISRVTMTLYTIAGTAGSTTVTATLTKNGVAQSARIPTVSFSCAGTGGSVTGSQTGSIPVAVGDVLNIAFTQTSGSPVVRVAAAVTCN